MVKLEKLLFGGMIAGMTLGGTACSSNDKESNEEEKQKTEAGSQIKLSDYATVAEYNAALFESCRSDIKFALAFCENYYEYVYNDHPNYSGKWTTASGLTVLYSADGRHCTPVTPDTKVPTIEENSNYKDYYLTYDIWQGVDTNGKKLGFGFEDIVKVPMDRDKLVAACVLRFCIGGKAFQKSKFLEYLNAGKSGAELAKTLTGYRVDKGVLNRCYFFAAILAGKMQYSDLLDLRANGCYNFYWWETVVRDKDKNGNCYKVWNPKYNKWEWAVKADKDGFATWIFSDLDYKLKKAKQVTPPTKLPVAGGKTVFAENKLVKEIVPDYVWQDVSGNCKESKKDTVSFFDAYVAEFEQIRQKYSCSANNDSSYIAYQNGDYDKALEYGKLALDLASTNKQKGAATYNIGISYSAIGKYNKAVKYLQQSKSYNPRPATDEALKIAQDKKQERRKKAGLWTAGFALGFAGCAAARKRYVMNQQRQYRR